MKPRFLLDEHIDAAIQRQLRRRDFRLEVLQVGGTNTVPAGTSDQDILVWAGANGFIVVTEDRSTMPVHIADHLTQELPFAGLLWVRPNVSIGRVAEELYLIWLASEAEEYRNQALYIPL